MGRASLDAVAPPPETAIATAVVYKGTTLPHVVVRRTAALFASGVSTHGDKGAASAKFWALHRRCALDPPAAAAIKAHERHLRKAGPLRAVAAYARDKNVLKLVRGGGVFAACGVRVGQELGAVAGG